MSRILQQQQIPLVAIANQAPPSLDPFSSLLYSHFLQGNVWLEFFVFSTVWNTLLANASGQQANMTIDPSIDFLAHEMNVQSYSAAGTPVQSPDYLLEVQERSGNNNWADSAIHIGNWTGSPHLQNVALTYRFPFPRYIRGNNTVTFKLTNNTATAARVDLALIGMRITYVRLSRTDLFAVPF